MFEDHIIKPILNLPIKNVSICAFSGYVNFPKRFERGAQELMKIFGKIKLYDIQNNTIEGRLKNFYNALTDSETSIIVSLTGGYNANELLDHLDFDFIANHAKLIIGFSDTTAIQLALFAKKRIVSIYGPALLPNFAEFKGANQETVASLLTLLTASKPFPLCFPKKISFSNDFWDKDDIQPLVYVSNTIHFSPHYCYDMSTEGILVGGNLNTILALAGTPYFPDTEEVILFLEDSYTNPQKLRRDLHTLYQIGVFQKTSGLLFGKFFGDAMDMDKQKEYCEVIDSFFSDYRRPILYQLDFGHHSPILSLPIGLRVRMDCENNTLTIVESLKDN